MCTLFGGKITINNNKPKLLYALYKFFKKDYKGEYYDDPSEYNIFTPGRAYQYYTCKKNFYLENMALEYKFHHSEEFLKKVQLLKGSISIRGIVSQYVRYQMKILMDDKQIKNTDKKKNILKIIFDKRRTNQLIEDNNNIKYDDYFLHSIIDLGIIKYGIWCTRFADKFQGWVFNKSYKSLPSYHLITKSFVIHAKYKPFALYRPNQQKILILENYNNEKNLENARNNLLKYALSYRSKMGYNFQTRKFSFEAKVAFLDTKSISVILCDLTDVKEYESRIIALANQFYLDRKTTPIIAEPEKYKCRWCKYLSICNEAEEYFNIGGNDHNDILMNEFTFEEENVLMNSQV